MKTNILSSYELECITAAAYEVNRQYCLMISSTDDSHVPWNQLPMDLKQVARLATAAIADGHTPEQSHDAWVRSKKSQGWSYGPQKNPETKEHPCLVPFSELSVDQQAKDLLWHTVVKSMLETRWKILLQ